MTTYALDSLNVGTLVQLIHDEAHVSLSARAEGELERRARTGDVVAIAALERLADERGNS
jgi:hypothetical protein